MNSPLTPDTPVVPPAGVSPFPSLKKHLRDQEIAHIHRAIERSGGDKKKAARLLDVSLATLYRKLEPDPPTS